MITSTQLSSNADESATQVNAVSASTELVSTAVSTVAAGTERALRKPQAALEEIARASSAHPRDVEAQFGAVRPALSPPVRLDRSALEDWAEFAARYRILRERPRVARAFDVRASAAR
jgi:hypothetical protein